MPKPPISYSSVVASRIFDLQNEIIGSNGRIPIWDNRDLGAILRSS
jgi:hypothetical protein